MHYKSFCNEKVPELDNKFADAIRFWLASIPTAAEAPEVDLRPDRRLGGGIPPYREKSAVGAKFKIQKHEIRNLRRNDLSGNSKFINKWCNF